MELCCPNCKTGNHLVMEDKEVRCSVCGCKDRPPYRKMQPVAIFGSKTKYRKHRALRRELEQEYDFWGAVPILSPKAAAQLSDSAPGIPEPPKLPPLTFSQPRPFVDKPLVPTGAPARQIPEPPVLPPIVFIRRPPVEEVQTANPETLSSCSRCGNSTTVRRDDREWCSHCGAESRESCQKRRQPKKVAWPSHSKPVKAVQQQQGAQKQIDPQQEARDRARFLAMKEASDKRREARIADRAFGSPPKSTYIQQPPPKQANYSSEPSDVWERAFQLIFMIVAGILVVAFMSRPSSSGSGSYSGGGHAQSNSVSSSTSSRTYTDREWYYGPQAQAEARELLQQHGTPNPSRDEIETVLRWNEALENPINKANPKNYIP